MDEPIRIISDLHLGHTASLAREIDQIGPLFHGVRTVIFNGDTVEMRSPRNRERATEILEQIEAFCKSRDALTHFINGNHDPIISMTNHMEIGDGSLLVTHGDTLLHEPRTPWDADGYFDADPDDEAFAPDDLRAADLRRLETILATNKRGANSPHTDHFSIPNGTWGQFTTFMKQTWPPRKFVHMVSTWRNNPVHALNLVRMYHPTARCIVVGHTHRPGIWHWHDYCVINTGSYLPMLGRMAVDFENGVVTARKVVFRRRHFHLGRVVARFKLDGQLRAS